VATTAKSRGSVDESIAEHRQAAPDAWRQRPRQDAPRCERWYPRGGRRPKPTPRRGDRPSPRPRLL